jgi:hypothetical protein
MSRLEAPTSIVHPVPPTCPACGSADVAFVLWGMPSYEAEQAAQTRSIDFAGCCMTEDARNHACHACGHTWDGPDLEL